MELFWFQWLSGLILLNNLVRVPDFRITIHLKTGPPRSGVRWHPSYDVDHVKGLVEAKVRKLYGRAAVKWVDVEIVARTSGPKIETKSLNL